MSKEYSLGALVQSSEAERQVDVKYDPKDSALRTITDFLDLNPDFILHGPQMSDPENTALALYDAEAEAVMSPSQRLARSMLHLETAVSTLRQVSPPNEEGETLRSDWDIIDGATGIVTSKRFYCAKTGSDFGTFLSCEYDQDAARIPLNGMFLHLTLPSDHYLNEVMRWGSPQEPVFYASEPDTVSPEWSCDETEMLANGGMAKRRFDSDRAWYDDEGNFASNSGRKDVFRRDTVLYRPLYDKDGARGIERYVEITQDLLRMLLVSAVENNRI